jgi:hypothetical protein
MLGIVSRRAFDAFAQREIRPVNHEGFVITLVHYCIQQASRHVPMTNACGRELPQHLRDSPQDNSPASRRFYNIAISSVPIRPSQDLRSRHHYVHQYTVKYYSNLGISPASTHNADRNLRSPPLPHPPQRTYLPDRRLLRNMVSAV